MKLPVYEIGFDENLTESGIDAIALTETPAIELFSIRFSDEKGLIERSTSTLQPFSFYDDYPQAASDNAARALRIRDEEGIDCGTAVGWARANQLAKREKISRETIARMSGFARQKGNAQGDPKEDCGALMWLAWGGDEGVEWAARKLKEIDEEKRFSFSVNEDKMIIAGPAIIPDKLIYRRDEEGREFFVVFRKEVIERMVSKFNAERKTDRLNLEHDSTSSIPGFLRGNWIVEDRKADKAAFYGFRDLPIGTWFIEVQITDRSIWTDIVRKMESTGFSIEGLMSLEKEVSSEINNKTKLKKMKRKAVVKVLVNKQKFNSTLQKFETIVEAERTDVLILSELEKGASVEQLSAEGEVVPAINGKYEMEIDDQEIRITVENGIVTEMEVMSKGPEVHEYAEEAPEGATAADTAPEAAEGAPSMEELAKRFDDLIARYVAMEQKIEEIVSMLPSKDVEPVEAKAETRSERFVRILQNG